MNVDQILDIAICGVRRASMFLGFSFNGVVDAAPLPNHNLWLPEHMNGIEYAVVPTTLPTEHLVEAKNNFEIWVVGCAIRELAESFAIFLDNVYHALLLVESSGVRQAAGARERLKRSCDKFHAWGTRDKLQHLEQKFGLTSPFSANLQSIAAARHCLAHRRGLVAARDCQGGEMRVSWRTLNFYILFEDGTEVPAEPLMGQVLEQAGNFAVKTEEATRIFQVGEQIQFSRRELFGICHTFQVAAQNVIEQFNGYAGKKGIPLTVLPHQPEVVLNVQRAEAE